MGENKKRIKLLFLDNFSLNTINKIKEYNIEDIDYINISSNFECKNNDITNISFNKISNDNRLSDIIEDAKIVFITVDLGDNHKKLRDAMRIIVALCKEYNTPIIYIGSNPFGFEGKIRNKNADIVRKNLKDNNYLSIIFNNDMLLKNANKNEIVGESRDMLLGQLLSVIIGIINGNNIEQLTSIIEDKKEVEILNIDKLDEIKESIDDKVKNLKQVDIYENSIFDAEIYHKEYDKLLESIFENKDDFSKLRLIFNAIENNFEGLYKVTIENLYDRLLEESPKSILIILNKPVLYNHLTRVKYNVAEDLVTVIYRQLENDILKNKYTFDLYEDSLPQENEDKLIYSDIDIDTNEEKLIPTFLKRRGLEVKS